MLKLLILVPLNMNKFSNGYEVLYLQQWWLGKVEKSNGGWDGGRWWSATVGDGIGGGRRQMVATGVGGSSGRQQWWRLVAETAPKQGKTEEGRGGRTGHGGGCWTPARAAATFGGAAGRRQGSGAGDRRRREEGEEEEKQAEGGSRAWETKHWSKASKFIFLLFYCLCSLFPPFFCFFWFLVRLALHTYLP